MFFDGGFGCLLHAGLPPTKSVSLPCRYPRPHHETLLVHQYLSFTLRTQQSLGCELSELVSSAPASSSISSPTSLFIANHTPTARSVRAPFSKPSASHRPSSSTCAILPPSLVSSPAQSSGTATAAKALAASKYGLKQTPSFSARGASSFGIDSAGSVRIVPAGSSTEDDVFHQPPLHQQDFVPLLYSSSVDTSRSYLKNANPALWPSDALALSTRFPVKVSILVAVAPAITSNPAATRTRFRCFLQLPRPQPHYQLLQRQSLPRDVPWYFHLVRSLCLLVSFDVIPRLVLSTPSPLFSS